MVALEIMYDIVRSLEKWYGRIASHGHIIPPYPTRNRGSQQVLHVYAYGASSV